MVSRAEFLQAFQSISASLSALSAPRQTIPAVSHAPTPSVSGHDWMARGQREIPHTITRAPDSPPQLSLHPSMAIVSEPAAQQLDHGCERPPPSSTRSSSPLSTRPSQSGNSSEDDDEGLARLQRLSIAETELRLVQRDMVRVLQLPPADEPPQPEHKTFKRRTGSSLGNDKVFPTLPLDQVCVEHMSAIMTAEKWRPHPRRENGYFRFPSADFEKFFSTPSLSDATRDKLAADEGHTTHKRIFADKTRNKLEDTLKQLDTASRYGMRTASFLLLLSEYLVSGCEEDSAIPADMLTTAFHCLDNGLRSVLGQFTRLSTLATSTRRGNVLDALFLPSQGARKRLETLPLFGSDLFAGKFDECMQAEAKRLKATEKINLKIPSTPTTRPQNKTKPSFVIPRRRPLKPGRGNFRGRIDNPSALRSPQTQPLASHRPQPGRGSRAAAPRYPGGWRK